MVVWGLKGSEDSSQEDEKSKCLLNKRLSYPVETVGHRVDLEQIGPAELPQLAAPALCSRLGWQPSCCSRISISVPRGS